MVWGFRRRGRASYPAPMAHRAELIAAACEIALKLDGQSDEAMLAAMQRRFAGGTPADMAAAEFQIAWAIQTKELGRDGDGRRFLRQVLDDQRILRAL